MARPRTHAPSTERRTRRARTRGYHHGDLANALVDVSVPLIEKHGLENFSLRGAAAECGVVISAAYKHFAAKDDLLRAVADVGFTALADQMEASMHQAGHGLEGTPLAEAHLVDVGRTYVLFGTERPQMFRLMFGPIGPRGGHGDPRPDAPSHRLSVLLLGALNDVLVAYGRTGVDLEASKIIAWALVHGFATMVVDGVWQVPSKAALDHMIAELGQTVLRSLR